MEITTLLYHNITSAERFARQMEYLNQGVFEVLEIGTILKGPLQEHPGNRVILTFDDGNSSDFGTVFPILKKYGLPANFFITTDFVGDRGRMSWSDIRELHKNGFFIGSHSLSHRDLSRLGAVELSEELHRSKLVMEDKLGISVEVLSLPHGGSCRRVYDAAQQTGYRIVFNSVPTYHVSSGDPRIFGRFQASDRMAFALFRGILLRDGRIEKRLALIHAVKNRIKSLLPYSVLKKVQAMAEGRTR